MFPRNSRTIGARFAAVAMAGLLAAGIGTVPAAHADPTADPRNITVDNKGSVTVHRYEGSVSTGSHGNGLKDSTLEQAAVDAGAAIAGATFTIYSLSNSGAGERFDLRSEAGWKELALLNGVIPSDDQFTAVGTQSTGADGVAAFTNLSIGAYKVCETTPASGYKPVECFMVTVPVTHATDRDHWVYDVHVYPKSSDLSVDKSVNGGKGLAAGDDVVWNIDTKLPARNANYSINSLVVADDFNGFLINGAVKVFYGKPDTVTPTETAWTEVPLNHFTTAITWGALGNPYTWGTVTATALPDAITYLKTGDPDVTHVRVQVTGTFNSLETKLTDNAGAAPWDPKPGNTDNTLFDRADVDAVMIDKDGKVSDVTDLDELRVLFGTITVTKKDQSNTAVAGAEFALFQTEAEAQAFVNAKDKAARTEALTAAKTFNICPKATGICTTKQTFATDTSGKAVFPDIWYQTKKNDVIVAPGTGEGPNSYFIVETKAPSGHELSPQIAEVALNGDIEVPFVDVTQNAGFKLPLAGSNGMIIAVVIGGVLMVIIAAGVLRREHTRGLKA